MAAVIGNGRGGLNNIILSQIGVKIVKPTINAKGGRRLDKAQSFQFTPPYFKMKKLKLGKNINRTNKYLVITSDGMIVAKFRLWHSAVDSIPKLRLLHGNGLKVVTRKEYRLMVKNKSYPLQINKGEECSD